MDRLPGVGRAGIHVSAHRMRLLISSPLSTGRAVRYTGVRISPIQWDTSFCLAAARRVWHGMAGRRSSNTRQGSHSQCCLHGAVGGRRDQDLSWYGRGRWMAHVLSSGCGGLSSMRTFYLKGVCPTTRGQRAGSQMDRLLNGRSPSSSTRLSRADGLARRSRREGLDLWAPALDASDHLPHSTAVRPESWQA